MRFAPALAISLVGLLAACAGGAEDTDSSGAAESSKSDESVVAYGPCGFTRAELIKQVSASRGDAITRGFEWYDDKVPFNKAATHDKYRTDCSGFVSMCWQLGTPGQTTSTLGTSKSGSAKLSSYDDLVPADALVWPGHHSMVFLGWNDTAHKGACVLEEASTASDMQFRVRLTASLKGSSFVPVRSNDFSEDTDYTPAKHAGSGNSSTSTGSTTTVDAGAGSSTGTGSSSGSSGSSTSTGSGSGDDTCTPYTAAAACKDAYDNRGVECGKVSDGCGSTVDCITAYPAGCGTNPGVVCSANKCVDTVCHPKTGAAACLAAGAECGTAPDGCGGTVSCDDVAGYGCATNETCAANNKCYAPNSVPADAGTTSTTTGATATTAANGNLTPAADEDNGDNAPATPDTTSTSKPTRTLSSSGCNAAPGTGMDLAPLAGLALVLAGLRRRNKKVCLILDGHA